MSTQCDGRGKLLCPPCVGSGKALTNTGRLYDCLACKGTGRSGPCDCEACKGWLTARREAASGKGSERTGRLF